MSSLSRAIAFAADAHDGQVDKLGEPYILHSLRVMLSMPTNEGRIVAVLHDVVEDTGLTLQCVASRGFADCVDALDCLTRRPGETYAVFIERCANNPVARAVKLADIADNLSPVRFDRLPLSQQQSLRCRYYRALNVLRGAA